MSRQQSTPVMLAGSAGGHLDLLRALAPDLSVGPDPVWVTSRTSRGRALRDAGERVVLLPEYGRSLSGGLRNVRAAARAIRRYRPRVVITAGAGVVVPFCILARLSGARLLHVETMARVTSPSRSARLLAKFSHLSIVQWSELKRAIPKAVVCRPLLLEGVPEGERAAGEGTFVAVGTHRQPFDRLITMVATAARDGVLPPPVFVQTGPASAPGLAIEGVEGVDYLSGDEMGRRLAGARVVVCHAGAGIISSALKAGRTPIVVPRRVDRAEHIDDHQLQLSRKLAEWGLIVRAEDGITPAHVEQALRPLQLPDELVAGHSIAEVVRADLASGAAS